MLGFLSSALGGTILGKVLSFGDKWFESYTHRKNAEVDILKAKASVRAEDQGGGAEGVYNLPAVG
jgi:hypothetical protein